jgi:GT2 family glycosyltransferase
MSSSKNIILVIGSHRSGTSVLSSLINETDVFLGDNLMEAADDNSTGFFEDKKIVELSNKFLKDIGIDWMVKDPIDFNNPNFLEPKTSYINSVCEFLEELVDTNHSTFLIKDPRMCILHSLWEEIIDRLSGKINFLPIVILRNPESIAQSISSRNNISSVDSLKILIAHLNGARSLVKSKKTFWVSYEQLLFSPFQKIYEIQHFFNLEIRLPDPIVFSNKMINDLNHFGNTPSITRLGKEYEKIFDETNNIDFKHLENFYSSIQEDDVVSDFEGLIILKHLNGIEKIIQSRIDKIEPENVQLRNKIKDLEDQNKLYQSKSFIIGLKIIIFSTLRAIYLILPLPEILKIKLRSSLAPKIFNLLNKKKKLTEKNTLKSLLIEPEHFFKENILSFKEVRNPKVSIIIPVYNELKFTLNCLKSISSHKTKYNFEIIIANDCSTDNTVNILNKIENIKVISTDKNLGFIKNCNFASKHARGEFILFLNNDTYVLEGWLDNIIDTFSSDENIKIVGSKLLYDDGSLQEAGGIIWSDASGWNWGNGEDAYHPKYNFVRDVDYVSGCSFCINKDDFVSSGLFDESLDFAYYEDTSKCFQIRNFDPKNRIVYQPFSQLIHYEGISNGNDISSGIKKYQTKNQEYFYKKYSAVLKKHDRNGLNTIINSDRYVSKHILIIDSISPRGDHDSGSLDQINLIDILIKNGMRVHLAPIDNFLHDGSYTEELQKKGVNCLYSPFYNSIDEVLKDYGDIFSHILIYRYHNFISTEKAIEKYCPKAIKVLMTVDLHHVRAESEGLKGSKLEEIKRNELYAIKNSHASVVLSDTELSYLKSLNLSNISQLPIIRESTSFIQKAKKESFTLGFIGGYNHPPNIKAVNFLMEDLWPALNKYFEKKEKVPPKLLIAGSNMPNELLNKSSKNVSIIGFQEDLAAFFDSIDASISPLFSGAGLKGKIVSSFSFSTPVLGTPLAFDGFPNKSQFNNIFLECKSIDEFIFMIEELIDDDQKYKNIVIDSWNYFNSNFTKDVLEDSVLKILSIK